MDIDGNETMKVLLGGIIATISSEVIQYVLIYSKQEYKELKKQVEDLSIRIEYQKDMLISKARQKDNEKKTSQLDNQFKIKNQEMSSYRLMSTMIVGFFMIIIISSLNTVFQGVVVARLPFQPFSFLQGVTHRGLLGSDYTECSHIFIYILITYIVRQNVQKICQFEPPKGHQMFFMDQYQK